MNIYIKNLNDYILRKNQDLLMELYEKKDKPAVAFFNMVDQALACQFHDKRQQEYIDIKSQQEYIKNILEDIELTPNTFYYSDDRSSKIVRIYTSSICKIRLEV